MTREHRPKPEALDDLPVTLSEFSERFPVKVDGQPLDLTEHSYLKPIYDATRFDRGKDCTMVLMTGAQVGKTIWLISSMIKAAAQFWGDNFGYFLPDQGMSDIFSSKRWLPIMRSHPLFASVSGVGVGSSKRDEDRKRVRPFGDSTIYFWYMGGKTSTESLPMRGVFFDEVRRMHHADIQRAEERMSHCSYPLNMKISTAKFPDADVHYYFKRTDQRFFHTKCRCKEGIVLAENWPNCVGVRGTEDYFYRCPKCDMEITQPQVGEFVARYPERKAIGFHVPQMLSPVMTPARLFQKYDSSLDRQEFYNSGLGMPYVDPTSIMVPLDVAMACVQEGLQWAYNGINCFMGVDQRGGENHVVIGDIDVATKKIRLRHLQIIQGEGKAVFADLYPLMERYDVDCCVIDALPSYNEAVAFGKRFKRRVFLAYYSENQNMIRWSDRDNELAALRKANKDSKYEYHVMLDRYKSLEWSLSKWVDRRIICPEPKALTQRVRTHGVDRISYICLGDPETHEQGLFYHLRSAAKRKIEVFTADSEKRERVETGAFRMVFENIGIDPHFMHAANYMCVAASRRIGGGEIYSGSKPVNTGEETPAEILERRPDITVTQAGDVAQVKKSFSHLVNLNQVEGTCGTCMHFNDEKNWCKERDFNTQASFPSCHTYIVGKKK